MNAEVREPLLDRTDEFVSYDDDEVELSLKRRRNQSRYSLFVRFNNFTGLINRLRSLFNLCQLPKWVRVRLILMYKVV